MTTNHCAATHSARAGRLSALLKAALCAALIAVCSQIAIPLPMIPINLALLAVYLTAFVLEGRGAMLAVGLYLLLGAVGLPVFAGFKGGLHALVGNTGGYLLGYLCAAGLIAALRPWADTLWKRALACLGGLLACYIPGTAWFVMLTGFSLPVSLGYCVWPFLPGDAVKIALAAWAAPQLQRALARL